MAVTALAGRRPLTGVMGLVRFPILGAVVLSELPVLALEPAPAPAVAGLLAGTIALGVACDAWNAAWERDRDALMERTRARPIPNGSVTPRRAYLVATIAACAAITLLASAAGTLAAALAASTLLFYGPLYTMLLKPRTPLALIPGAIAGASAPLLADALDGRLGAAGMLVFTTVFAWQLPHVLAVHLWRSADYAAGGFPILPSLAGAPSTRRLVTAGAVVLVPVLALPSLLGIASLVFGAMAILGGASFAATCARGERDASSAGDRLSFRASILLLAGWLLALSIDAVARTP